MVHVYNILASFGGNMYPDDLKHGCQRVLDSCRPLWHSICMYTTPIWPPDWETRHWAVGAWIVFYVRRTVILELHWQITIWHAHAICVSENLIVPLCDAGMSGLGLNQVWISPKRHKSGTSKDQFQSVIVIQTQIIQPDFPASTRSSMIG